MKLSELPIGSQGLVMKIDPQGMTEATFERLGEMGFIVGSRVRALHSALGGDPIAFEVRGGMIAMRKAEAAHIEVDLS